MSTGYMSMCLCCSFVRWTHMRSVPVSLPFSPSQWVLEYVRGISIFKWKGCYKVCWARRLKAGRSAIMVFWSLTSCYHLKEKNEITCLAENVFSPLANTSHSSSDTFLSLFPELVSDFTYGTLDCRIWGCVVLSDNLKGSGRRSSSVIRSGAVAGCIMWVRALFSPLFSLCLEVALRNTEWNWTVCLLRYSKRCISTQKCSICLLFPFCQNIHSVVMLTCFERFHCKEAL